MLYQYVPIHTLTYWYILACTSTNAGGTMTRGDRCATPTDGRADPARPSCWRFELGQWRHWTRHWRRSMMAFLRMRGRTRRVSLWATRQRPPSRTAARQALGGGSSKTAAQRGRTAVGPGSGDVEPAPGDVWCGARARMLSVFNTGGVAAQLARQSGLEDATPCGKRWPSYTSGSRNKSSATRLVSASRSGASVPSLPCAAHSHGAD